VTEYRFDWRIEREPSCEDMVFWRETGMKEEDEDVEALDGACSMETAMAVLNEADAGAIWGETAEEVVFWQRNAVARGGAC
jgi:hypothetical protein